MKKQQSKIEKQKYQKKIFYSLGSFFLLLQLVIIIANLHVQRYDIFFWFCNHTPILFSIAFFFNQKDMIKALINVGFLAQFLWTIDLLGKLLFNFYIFDVTRYVFESMNGLYVLIPILVHVFSINIALYFTYKDKPTIRTLVYSLVYIMFLYVATLHYTLNTLNVNCVHKVCGLEKYTITGYTYFWPEIMFFLIVVPTQIIQYLMYISYKNRKSKIRVH